MEKFDEMFAEKITAGDEQVLKDWIEEMDHKMRYTECTQAESNALKRRIRIVKDYIRFHCAYDDTENNHVTEDGDTHGGDDDPRPRYVEP